MASLLSISLTACGSGGSDSGTAAGGDSKGSKVTLELAISKSSQDSAFIQQDILDEFEKQTNVRVNLQLIPAEQTTTVLQTKLAVDETPDIIQYNLASAVTDLNLERNFEILDNEPWASRIVNKDVLSSGGHLYSFHVSQDTGMQGSYTTNRSLKTLVCPFRQTMKSFWLYAKRLRRAASLPYLCLTKMPGQPTFGPLQLLPTSQPRMILRSLMT